MTNNIELTATIAITIITTAIMFVGAYITYLGIINTMSISSTGIVTFNFTLIGIGMMLIIIGGVIAVWNIISYYLQKHVKITMETF